MKLQVHIADGIKFVREFNNHAPSDRILHQHEDTSGISKSSSKGSCIISHADGNMSPGLDILVIDVDSSDSRYLQILYFMQLNVGIE